MNFSPFYSQKPLTHGVLSPRTPLDNRVRSHLYCQRQPMATLTFFCCSGNDHKHSGLTQYPFSARQLCRSKVSLASTCSSALGLMRPNQGGGCSGSYLGRLYLQGHSGWWQNSLSRAYGTDPFYLLAASRNVHKTKETAPLLPVKEPSL